MIGRYMVEISLIVRCGMGLHPSEITQVGGDAIVTQFNWVCYEKYIFFPDTDFTSSRIPATFYR